MKQDMSSNTPSHTGAERPAPHLISRRSALAALGGGAALLPLSALAGCAPDLLGGGSGSGGPSAGGGLATIEDSVSAPRRVSIAMVGDVLVHEGVWMSGERADGTRNYDHIFAPARELIEDADIAIVNQETVLGGDALGLSGYPAFNSPQEMGDAEAAAGFDVACSATNHALDKGFAGIEATRAFWRENHPEVVSAGIAETAEAAAEIPLITRDDITVAILNYTEGTNGIPIPAASPWCVNMLEREAIAADVSAAREQGTDIVVVCPHWGIEYQLEPTDGQRAWASYFAELGVDAVIGTHPHVLEPVELVARPDGGQMPVFWSLGNFISWQARKDTMVGGFAKVTFEMADDAPRLAGVALTPVVSHLSLDTQMASYPIASYTEELAGSNGIRRSSGCGDFTLAWCHDLCARVLGEGYDRERGVFELAI